MRKINVRVFEKYIQIKIQYKFCTTSFCTLCKLISSLKICKATFLLIGMRKMYAYYNSKVDKAIFPKENFKIAPSSKF